MTLTVERTHGAEFFTALAAAERCPSIPNEHDVYGLLIGSWDLEVVRYWHDLAGRGITGEAHFARVLAGVGVQDLWIMPRRPDRRDDMDPTLNMYGTTLRLWDPSIKAWQVTYINAANNGRADLIGRRVGCDIVQIGTRGNGMPVRWRFVDIAENSFRWVGEALENDGQTWRVEGEFIGRRR